MMVGMEKGRNFEVKMGNWWWVFNVSIFGEERSVGENEEDGTNEWWGIIRLCLVEH